MKEEEEEEENTLHSIRCEMIFSYDMLYFKLSCEYHVVDYVYKLWVIKNVIR